MNNRYLSRAYIVLAILLIVFNVVAFAAPFERKDLFWIGYIFATVAVLFQIYILNTSFDSEGRAKHNFYGFPIATIGTIYLVIQLIVSFVEMLGADSKIPDWPIVILNVVILAAAMISCIGADIERIEAVRQEAKTAEGVSLMKSLIISTATLPELTDNAEMKKLLQNAAEKFRFSDPVSSTATAQIEAEMQQQIVEIEQLLSTGKIAEAKELTTKLLVNLSNRNRNCLLNK